MSFQDLDCTDLQSGSDLLVRDSLMREREKSEKVFWVGVPDGTEFRSSKKGEDVVGKRIDFIEGQ